MMNKMHTLKGWGFYIAATLFVLTACGPKTNSSEKEISKEKGLPVLDMAGKLSASVTENFTWNSIAKEGLLKPLQTEHMIGNALLIEDIWDDKVLMADAQTNRIFVFDTEGKELHSFKHHGNGPGEYVYLTYVQFHRPDSTIFVHDNNGKVLHYTFDGQCVKEHKTDFFGNVSLLDEYGKAYTLNASGNVMVGKMTADYRAENGFLPFPSDMSQAQKMGNRLLSGKSVSGDKLLFNPVCNDTLYSITEQGAVPFCVLGKGEHQPLMEDLPNFINLQLTKNEYIIRMRLAAFSSYLYLSYRYNDEMVYDLWDIHTRKLVAKYKSDGTNYGFKYILPSGNEVYLQPAYVTQDCIAFILFADDCIDDIEGLQEDDNQVMLVLKLK